MNDTALSNELLTRNLGSANRQPTSGEMAEESESPLEIWGDLLDIWDFNGPVLIY